MNKTTIVIWVNSPPQVELGAFEGLQSSSGGSVIFAVLGKLRAERVNAGWSQHSFPEHVRNGLSVDDFTLLMNSKFPDAIHMFAGMTGRVGRALTVLTRSVPPKRILVYSERPGVYGPCLKRISRALLQPIRYRYLARKYRRRVGILLPLGSAALRRFDRYGWPAENMAPFMYCPPVPEIGDKLRQSHEVVRFLYVGRLSRFAKGTDILMKACDSLSGEWTLTIVGGHGDMCHEVERWSATRERISYLGALPSSQVGEVIAEHDVCIVPSRVDGWNVVINEAIYAGRGVITTQNVGSDELVAAARAGIVIDDHSHSSLAKAMQKVVNCPNLVEEWSRNAKNYSHSISPESVGVYISQLLDALEFGRVPAEISVPWLPKKPRED
ncbi:glycosyltransferase family 4 protein [Flaviflexus equikiangi]|uniref:Glycosyltransferase family 4 protein n=1 Tax=Flaviflexus equikiangi TaxID=2758573 RepID=A0ABS2TJE7_9ACTO|nr:glycosyltransferase family 4 protein [Flaviflexus equikiangi]MBM9433409.1 glycosyltransferase family 4 protein [Flaviflexus equikiangi]